MKSVERSGVDGTSKDPRGFFADVLCQVDGRRVGTKILPAALPKPESWFWAEENFVDRDVQLSEVVDCLAVIFDLNVKHGLFPLRPTGIDRDNERE